MTHSGQVDEHFFTPNIDGNYRFVIADLVSGGVDVRITDSNGFQLENRNSADGGINLTLEGGTTYTIRISWRSGSATRVNTIASSYTLRIWHQKPTVDTSEYTEISDSMQFSSQINNYTFTATRDGEHRFVVSGLTSGGVDVRITNSDGFQLAHRNSADGGIGITLTAGTTYSIRVSWRSGSATRVNTVASSYLLRVWYQKPTVDISGYSGVTDSMQFIGQVNNYTFTADRNGEHRFAISGLTSGGVDVRITDSSGFQLANRNSADGGITVSLDAGTTYTIRVSWRSGSATRVNTVASPYTLSITYP